MIEDDMNRHEMKRHLYLFYMEKEGDWRKSHPDTRVVIYGRGDFYLGVKGDSDFDLRVEILRERYGDRLMETRVPVGDASNKDIERWIEKEKRFLDFERKRLDTGSD
jgi:hypothetical protein